MRTERAKRAPPGIDEQQWFSGYDHARFHDPDTVYHVLFRTFQGRFLLVPDSGGVLVDIMAGVIGRAQENYPNVRLYAYAGLSSHMHLMLKGSPEQIPAFVGFIKREISRRWGAEIDWPGSMWESYASSALPTPQSQQECFAYVLSQSVKERLVECPTQWPGLHCASQLAGGEPLVGTWLDGTRYGKALDRKKRRRHRRRVNKADYQIRYEIRLDQLPIWADLSDEQYRNNALEILAGIKAEAARERGGLAVLGRRRILEIPRDRRSEIPKPPWFEHRRRLITWSRKAADETRAYLHVYWQFQRAHREASQRFRAGELDVEFPPGAFRPPTFRRPEPDEHSAAA